VLRSIIPRNVRLAEAPSHGQPIHLYDRGSRGAIAYIGLAGEIIRRERARHAAAGGDVAAEPAVDEAATGASDAAPTTS
jgi:chromosome partitioning protein